jgi:hypothetical protein
MAKICPACQAENRDEAQFCRTCGTPFPLIPPDPSAPAAGAPCTECGFVNKPGVRYCAKCGVNLMGTVVVPRSQRPPPAAPGSAVPAYAATASYPPGQTPTYVPPPATPPSAGVDLAIGADDRDDPHAYPPAGTLGSSGDPDPLHVPDVPDPRLAIEAEQAAADEHERTVLLRPPVGVGFGVPPAPPPPRRTGLWAGLAVAVVVAAGVAWYFLRSSSEPTKPAQTAPEPAAVASAPAPAEPQAAAPASSPDAAGSAAATANAPPGSAPDAAAAMPPGDAAASAAAAQANVSAPTDEERLAAEKRAREKAARDRAEREARAKAAAEQREQAAARQRAEQEAAAAAAAQQRARQQTAPAPAAVAPPTPAPRPRTVAEICGGRNIISQSICESRECGAPEHAGEATCRKIREQEDRHREGLR